MTRADHHVRQWLSPRDGRQSLWAHTRPLLQWVTMFAVAGAIAFFVARPASSQQTDDTGASQGPLLYQSECASCHGNRGEGTFRGPSLIGVGAASADYWLRSGRMPLDSPDAEPVRSQPAFSNAQIRELVDYVAGLGEGPAIPDVDLTAADVARGGQLYRVNCAACHNWDGKGGALVNRENAPDLHDLPGLQVAEAVRIGPSTMPQFTSGQLSEEDLNDVVAYVDYISAPLDAGGYGLAHWGPSTETVAGFLTIGVLVLVTGWLGERERG